MKVRSDWIGVDLSTGTKYREIKGDGETVREYQTIQSANAGKPQPVETTERSANA